MTFAIENSTCAKTACRLALAVLMALWLGAWCGVVQAASIPFGSRTIDITAREQPIAGFLQDLFGAVGVPVSVSATLNTAVNGHFQGPAERVYRNIAKAFNLVEYYDGSVVHVYSAQDMATRTLPAAGATSTRVMHTMGELGLADERNKVRLTSEGTLVATGTKRFIEMFEELVRAETADQKAAPLPTGFKVFYLRYAWAQDVTMSLGGRQVLLPGVASTVRALMTGNPKSQLVTTSLEQSPSSTVPGMRNGKDRPARQGTLGAPGADPNQPSAPALAAAYGNGALPGMTMAGSPASQATQQSMTLGDSRQVRVEADARLNAVIVRDAPDRMPQYEQLIAALDVEPQAVEIEATIIDVNTEKLRELGINWRYTKGHGSLLFGKGDASDLQLTPTTPVGNVTPMGQGGFVSAVLGNAGQFIARINALQDQGVAKVVSSPQVLTLSNVEAVFDNSQTFYVRVAGRDEVDLFNVAAGTTLRVTPHVFKEGGEVRIKMLVAVEDGSLSSRTVDTLPVVDRSSISTQAMIFEGESLLVGGITRDSTAEEVSQVPGLGNVPVLGALFRNKRTSATRVERMFLITPRISGGRRPAPVKAPATAAAPTPPDPASAPFPASIANEPSPAAPAPKLQSSSLRVEDRRGPRATYGRGESYEIDVMSPRDGYLYCYLIDEHKQLNQFFPNPNHRSAAVRAGNVMSFPGSYGFRLVAGKNGQRETVACITTEKDLGFAPVTQPAAQDAEALRVLFGRMGSTEAMSGMLEVKAP